jgi:hypothetical protein
MKGHHFKDAVEVIVALKIASLEVTCNFQKCFKQLYECWQKHVTAEGQHTECTCM